MSLRIASSGARCGFGGFGCRRRRQLLGPVGIEFPLGEAGEPADLVLGERYASSSRQPSKPSASAWSSRFARSVASCTRAKSGVNVLVGSGFGTRTTSAPPGVERDVHVVVGEHLVEVQCQGVAAVGVADVRMTSLLEPCSTDSVIRVIRRDRTRVEAPA